ncbi:hypothetical protein Ddc_19689 [Ditylenchus destructor]|nr:hypothetical protein Ddc_19689 [Ditylenchus destructor]
MTPALGQEEVQPQRCPGRSEPSSRQRQPPSRAVAERSALLVAGAQTHQHPVLGIDEHFGDDGKRLARTFPPPERAIEAQDLGDRGPHRQPPAEHRERDHARHRGQADLARPLVRKVNPLNDHCGQHGRETRAASARMSRSQRGSFAHEKRGRWPGVSRIDPASCVAVRCGLKLRRA